MTTTTRPAIPAAMIATSTGFSSPASTRDEPPDAETGSIASAKLEIADAGDFEMAQVNRYLKDKAMDHIDHALGRPVDPRAETHRNYFYLVGDTDLRRDMAASPHWQSIGKTADGEYFAVTTEGRAALTDHLKAIGDKHRRWIVSYAGYQMEAIATTAAKARYSKWLDISDTNDSLTFGHFQRNSKVRAA